MAPPPGIDLNQYLVLEIDGPGATVASFDAPALLEFAASFFQLVRLNAGDSDEPLALTDVRVFDKCAAVAVKPDRLDVAKECAHSSVRQIAGTEPPPKGGTALVARARSAVGRLPTEQRAKVLVGAWEKDVVSVLSVIHPPLDSILSIRATPIRIGGRRTLVRFASDLEDDFTLEATKRLARELGPHLYSEVAIEARIRRAPDRSIESGTLVAFWPVQGGDPRPAWLEWYRSVNGGEQGDEDRH